MKTYHNARKQRRALLKSVAIGGSVISASQLSTGGWVKPVVDSVILPAHAATTDEIGILPGEVGSRYSFIDPGFNAPQSALGMQMPLARASSENTEASFANKLLDMIIPSAAAEPINTTGVLELFLEITAEETYQFVFLMTFQPDPEVRLVFYAAGPVILGSNTITGSLCLADGGPSGPVPITVHSVTPTLASVTFGEGAEAINIDLLYDQNAIAPENISCIVDLEDE